MEVRRLAGQINSSQYRDLFRFIGAQAAGKSKVDRLRFSFIKIDAEIITILYRPVDGVCRLVLRFRADDLLNFVGRLSEQRGNIDHFLRFDLWCGVVRRRIRSRGRIRTELAASEDTDNQE